MDRHQQGTNLRQTVLKFCNASTSEGRGQLFAASPSLRSHLLKEVLEGLEKEFSDDPVALADLKAGVKMLESLRNGRADVLDQDRPRPEIERAFVEVACAFSSIAERVEFVRANLFLLKPSSLGIIKDFVAREELPGLTTKCRFYHNFLVCCARSSIETAAEEFDIFPPEVCEAVNALVNTQSIVASVRALMNAPELGRPEVVRVLRFMQAKHEWDSRGMRHVKSWWDQFASYRPEVVDGRVFSLSEW